MNPTLDPTTSVRQSVDPGAHTRTTAPITMYTFLNKHDLPARQQDYVSCALARRDAERLNPYAWGNPERERTATRPIASFVLAPWRKPSPRCSPVDRGPDYFMDKHRIRRNRSSDVDACRGYPFFDAVNTADPPWIIYERFEITRRLDGNRSTKRAEPERAMGTRYITNEDGLTKVRQRWHVINRHL